MLLDLYDSIEEGNEKEAHRKVTMYILFLYDRFSYDTLYSN